MYLKSNSKTPLCHGKIGPKFCNDPEAEARHSEAVISQTAFGAAAF
jgi:hypothetical protein